MKIKFILFVVMLGLLFFSCAAEENTGGAENLTETAQNDAGIPDNFENTGETAAERSVPLPEKDFDGYDFKFLVREFNDGGYWGAIDIYAEEETGEPINDAVFRRNRIIEERYNITVSEMRTTDIGGQSRRAVLANSHEYDVSMPNFNEAAGFATQGLLMDVRSRLPHLQLEQIWWDQRANQMMSIWGRQFILVGDMTLTANDATWVIMFNKDVAEEYNMGSLYNYVAEDNWTFDTFFGLVRQVSKDIDGNGVFDENDQIGLLTDSGARTILIYNTGETVAAKDGDDMPYISLNTERTISAAQKVFEIISDRTISINAHTDLGHISDPWTDGVNKMFQENRGLFYMISLTVMHRMRAMDSDFGILPSPKLDNNQTEYFHTVQPSTTNSLILPVTTPDPELASIILEDMNFESRDTVRHAYFDITVTNKMIRDEESAEMLDLIFNTRIYDLGFIFNWGGMGYLLETVYPDSGRFVSRYETAEPRALREMERTIEEFNNIDN